MVLAGGLVALAGGLPLENGSCSSCGGVLKYVADVVVDLVLDRVVVIKDDILVAGETACSWCDLDNVVWGP
eukprot:8190599-Ditylum_brightwellii.AAC.1